VEDARRVMRSQRFRILKRDDFTCQYCGRRAPAVVLQVDHRVPVRYGGGNMDDNLVTACEDCNQGKGSLEIIPDPRPEYYAIKPMSEEQTRALEVVPAGTVSEAEVMAARTPVGGWTMKTLTGWGVPWPPPRGWKAKLTGIPSSEAGP
jgi:hypothetical protein